MLQDLYDRNLFSYLDNLAENPNIYVGNDFRLPESTL